MATEHVNLTEIKRALTNYRPPGSDACFEIRALATNTRGNVVSGIFHPSQLDQAVAAAAELSGQARGVYFTPNEVACKRAPARLVDHARQVTKDKDITRRLSLLIDFDSVRPPDVSSTDTEHNAALKHTHAVGEILRKVHGFPDPTESDSGNGGHLNYNIELPNDRATTELVKGFLEALDRKFSNAGVKVDTTVYNAARIWKLPGTLACKGPNTPERPHRLTRILKVPKTIQLVTREMLQSVIDAYPPTDADDGAVESDVFEILKALNGVPHGERDVQIWKAACSFRGSNAAKKVALQLCLEAAKNCEPPFSAKKVREKVERVYKTYPAGSQSRDDKRPSILNEGGQLPWIADRAEEILRDGHATYQLYERAEMMMQIGIAKLDKYKGVERPPEAIVLRSATPPMMRDVLTRAIDWRKRSPSKKGATYSVNCPADVAAVMLSRVPNLKPLRGIIEAPIMRPDGTILMTPGYDEATRLFLYSSVKWLSVPDHPTDAEVEGAVRFLLEPLSDFPFVEESAASVTLSAFLTGLQRRLLSSAPLHAFDAPLQGSGKSLEADLVAILATGHPPVRMSMGWDAAEMQKKLTSVLLAGDPIILIDNVTASLRSESLATILTESTFSDRILGRSEMSRALPTNCLWLASGNNMRFSGDMPTRAIVSRIDARCENPEERSGFKIANLREWMQSNRAPYVRAALTVLKGYEAAGRPQQSIKAFGRFEEWTARIRSAIVWAGLADPCTTRKRIIDSDPERSATCTVFQIWHELFKEEPIALAWIVKRAENNAPLNDALLEVAAVYNNPSRIDIRRLANWCRDRDGRRVDDLVLVKGEINKTTKAHTWHVANTTSDASRSYTVTQTLSELGKPKEPPPSEPDEFEPPEDDGRRSPYDPDSDVI